MTSNLYEPLAPGSGSSDGIKEAATRRNASIGSLMSEESEQLLADYTRAEAQGLKLSPTLTMARGYAEGYRDAAKKTGQA